MARYRGPVCRLCRREATKLFLKGERCFTEKCAIEKRNFAPGQHGKSRRARIQGYGLQLREKQKVKRIFGLLEKQFRIYFERAERQRGITGEILLQLLERRLDNAIYRLGFASSRAQARLLVRHGHVRVGDRRVNIPSYILRPGEVMSVSQKYSKNPQFQQSLETAKSRGTPPWLELGEDQTSGKVISLPKREDVGLPVQEQLVVELYSK
ncbi:MAG: 30S ribosomal protein S4 [Vicinamibacteria bacterium]